MGREQELSRDELLDNLVKMTQARDICADHAGRALEERDRLREALTGLERSARIYHRELSRSEDDGYPEVADFLNALLAARSALSPESNPEGQ